MLAPAVPKVLDPGATVTAVLSSLLAVMLTSPLGTWLSRTRMVPDPPSLMVRESALVSIILTAATVATTVLVATAS